MAKWFWRLIHRCQGWRFGYPGDAFIVTSSMSGTVFAQCRLCARCKCGEYRLIPATRVFRFPKEPNDPKEGE
jgi:hypothetical protein